MSRNYSDSTLKILFSQAGAKCTICQDSLYLDGGDKDNPNHLAEIAHIAGLQPKSARYDIRMTEDERNSIDNLMIVCPNCHTTIDKQPDKFTTEDLKLKKQTFVVKLQSESMNITSQDINEIVEWISASESIDENLTNVSFRMIDATDKLKKNDLSEQTKAFLRLGSGSEPIVKRFIESKSILYPEFPDKIQSQFKNKYLELKDSGIKGDMIFVELWDYTYNKSKDVKKRSAALAVIAHLFIICEIFES